MGKRSTSRKKGRGRKEEKGNLRTERKDGHEALLGESNYKENGGISLPTRVERWSPSKICRPEGLLCDPKKTSMVIPIQNVRSVILKTQMLELEGAQTGRRLF